jgi:ABC-type transport system substrate-binding protein
MRRVLRATVAMAALLATLSIAHTGAAQKGGGILKMYTPDSPASMSLHEEATVFRPMMGDSTLIMFDQHVPRVTSIDRARSGNRLVVNEDGTALTFHLRQGVVADGKPSPRRM